MNNMVGPDIVTNNLNKWEAEENVRRRSENLNITCPASKTKLAKGATDAPLESIQEHINLASTYTGLC